MKDYYSLGCRLSKSFISVTKRINMMFERNEIDLSHSQFIVLRFIMQNEGVSQIEIASLMNRDASAIKRTIDYLEKKELIIRKQESHRRKCIYLTNKGRKLLPIAINLCDEVMNDLFGHIDDKAYKLLTRTLDKIFEKSIE